MQHQCLQCRQQTELPDGHRLIVCPLWGAHQPKLNEKKPTPDLTEKASAPTTLQALPAQRKGLNAITLAICGVIAIGFLVAISWPSYNGYTQKASERSGALATPVSDTTSAYANLRSIVAYTEIFNAKFQKIKYTPHADLPALAQELNTLIGDAAAVQVPQCAFESKQLIIFSMTSAHDAVRTKHGVGGDINNPAVIRQIELSTQLAADAQAAMRQMNC